ncbi:hypothetical protein BOX15_Mlig000929g4, partial [Macrostomum lignano]
CLDNFNDDRDNFYISPILNCAMFPKFNFPQFWPEDDGRGHYCRNYLASDRSKAPAFGQATYADLGHIGGHGESLTQVASFEPLPYRIVGAPVCLSAEPVRFAGSGWPCSRERHRQVRLACVAASTAGRHFGGRPAASSLTGVESARDLLREMAEATSLADFPLARLARLPLHITQFLTATPPSDAQDADAGVDALGIDPLNPESLADRMIGAVSGRHCGSGTVWASATAGSAQSDSFLVANASGANLDTLRVSTLKRDRMSKRRRLSRRRQSSSRNDASWRLVTRWTSASSVTSGNVGDSGEGQIYEIVGDAKGDGAGGLMIAVRRKDRFQLFRSAAIDAAEPAIVSPIAESSPASTTSSSIRLLSTSLNPHIPGEVVTMDSNLVAKLWDTRGFETTGAACRWSRQFPADQLAPWAPGEAWASASIGAHHRSLICVGGRLAELSDLRSPPTAAAGVRLLELPSGKSPERLRCRVSVGPHGHLIGSEGNLRLVDNRMTGNRCLLHTRCPLHGAPTFARWLSEPSELLLLGAQTTGDIAAVRLQAADQSLPPRISSESRLLPLRPPAAGSAGASLDGLRGLAAIHRDSNEGDVLMLRFTGRGRLCLQHLKCTTDTTATEEELVARKATIKLNNKQCRKSRLPAKQAASLLSFKLPIEDGDIVEKLRSNILNQRPPLSLSADRRTPDSLPHLGIKEYCTAEEQAELEPGSLVLAKLWHGQDPTAAVKKRLAAFEALEIQRAEEAAAAAAGTDTPAADSDIFNADSSAA